MKRTKQWIALALVFTLLCGTLAGCGGGGKGDKVQGGSPAPGEMVWDASFTSLPGEVGYFTAAAIGDDAIYAGVSASVDDSRSESIDAAIYKLSTDGKTAEKLPNYVPAAPPEGLEGTVNIDAMCTSPDGGLWVGESIYAYHYDLPENFSGTPEQKAQYYVADETQRSLRKLDASGAEVCTVDLTQIIRAAATGFYIQDLLCDAAGNVYLTGGNVKLYAFGPDGAPLYELQSSGWISNLLTQSDGKVAASFYGNTGFEVAPIDGSNKSWGKSVSLLQYPDSVISGAGDYLFYYVMNSKVYGYNAETGTTDPMFSYLDCSIDQDYLRAMTVLDDGSFFGVSSNPDEKSGDITIIVQKEASQVTEKTTLTLASLMYLDNNLRKQILKFNKQSDKYRIEVLDYSQYATEDDYAAGLTKLNTEIIAGNGPDMLAVDQLPMNQYVGRGLMVDLYPYIDSDQEIAREDFIPSILKAAETDGGLYMACPNFYVMSLAGRADVVGDEMGWSIDDMISLYDRQPEGTLLMDSYFGQQDILYYLLCMNMDRYVNWQTGTSDFDNQDFIKVLEFCGRFPKDSNYEEANSMIDMVSSGKQLLAIFSGANFQNVLLYEALFGGTITYKGFPREEGIGNVAYFESGVAMTTNCKDKEGAWSFLRTLLTEEYQSSDDMNYFPTNQAAFDQKMEEVMVKKYATDPVTGEQVEAPIASGFVTDTLKLELYALTPEQADRTIALIDSVSGTVSFDNSVMEIVTDEAQAYFNGTKTPEEVASLVQNRVNLYVNEQK